MSLFSGAFGYFWSNLNLAICVLTLAALHGVVAVHDLENPIFNTRHLLVAVSRATHHSLVRIKR